MAGRQLYVSFVDAGVKGIVSLYEDLAPRTCETLWAALAKPIQVVGFHAAFAGPEVMTGLPPEAQTFDPTSIPNENQTCFPGPGECLWYYQGRHAMKGLPEELWEIGIFYDVGGRTFGPLGWTPVNIFGRITENLDAFAALCRRTRMEGAKTLEIGRL